MKKELEILSLEDEIKSLKKELEKAKENELKQYCEANKYRIAFITLVEELKK